MPTSPPDNSSITNEFSKLRTELFDVLWGGGAQTDSDIFDLLTRLVLAKTYDEHANSGKDHSFRLDEDEKLETALRRIDGLYRKAMAAWMHTETEGSVRQQGKGTDEQIRFAIEKLACYNLSGAVADGHRQGLIGDLFEQIMRTNFKQSKGQFFTHPNIIAFMVDAVGIAELASDHDAQGLPPPAVIDPSAGSGGFLSEAVRAMSVAAGAGCGSNVVGLEINSDLGLAAQVNMLLHGDGSPSVLVGPKHGDGLAEFDSYPQTCSLLSQSGGQIDGYDRRLCERFDVVLTNPPFSAGISDGESQRYEKGLESAGRTKSSEHLFVERWFQLLKPGGRLAAVVPDSLLDARSASIGRDYLIKYFWVRAVVSLPSSAFYPYTSTKTSIVFAQKKTSEEIETLDGDQTSESMLASHGHISMHQASSLGYRRTQKQEMLIASNDLVAIAGKLHSARLWQQSATAGTSSKTEKSAICGFGIPQPRLDVGFALWQQKCAEANGAMPATDLFDVCWVAGQPPEDNADGQWVVEIGDLDRAGRSTPKWVPNDITVEHHHPETQSELERLLSKVRKNKFGPVSPWSVLVPKTRPYLRKFGLYGPGDQVWHTSDLLVLQPKIWLTERCAENAIATDSSVFEDKDESERASACCLLWLLCTHGPIGDLLALIARWGKEYPTLHLQDIETASMPESALERWIQENKATSKATQLRGLVISTADWQQTAVYDWFS